MYVFLLFLGGITTAAGLALVASVARGHDAGFDSETITPGTIAAVGGLLLVGLGFTVRALQRIERELASRPSARPSRAGEAPAAAAERADAPATIPFPPRPKAQPSQQAAATAPKTPPAAADDDAALERLREKFPALVRLENAPAVEETDASMLPQPSIPAEDAGGIKNGAAVARTNGATPPKSVPRVEVNGRPAGSPARAKGSVFDAFWPMGPRGRKDIQAAPAPLSAAESAPANDVPAPRPASDAPPAPAQPPATVLKSGVVEGMAYTLYSDGSIEAQLPEGTLRFASITELRGHLESSS